ncbi:MAG: biotin-dependent carboxyltransferase family protein [Rhodospirillales bacterium]|jgi:biotin-dependent carboxylase-like uncharacterized protein
MSLLVHRPGLMSTLQDEGRLGLLDRGVPPSGALDLELLVIANRLCGNEDLEAGLELIGQGPVLEITAESLRLAVAGEAAIRIDGEAMASWRSFTLHRGQRIELGAITTTRAAYLAVTGGFAAPPILGSRSAYVRAGLGIRLQEGLALALRNEAAPQGPDLFLPHPDIAPPAVLRVIAGPQSDAFTLEARRLFFETTWLVGDLSDRMGLRLQGPKLAHAAGPDIPTEGLVKGCIQVPGDGQPILLLCDHQTTGGYAKIAVVIGADMPAAGRLMPGSRVRFQPVSWAEAKAALQVSRQRLQTLLGTIRPLATLDEAALFAANLVSGAVDALDQDQGEAR